MAVLLQFQTSLTSFLRNEIQKKIRSSKESLPDSPKILLSEILQQSSEKLYD